MSDQIIADEIIVEFVTSDGDEVLRADLLELMVGVYACTGEKQHECVQEFRDWLNKTHGKVVSLIQAATIYDKVCKRYAEFKKKLDDDLNSHDSSISDQEALLVE